MFPHKLTKSADVKLKIRQKKQVHYHDLYVEQNFESSLPSEMRNRNIYSQAITVVPGRNNMLQKPSHTSSHISKTIYYEC